MYNIQHDPTSYSVLPSSAAANTPQYLATDRVPDYAAMMYTESQEEIINSIKYHSGPLNYDRQLESVKEQLSGPPLEFYVPVSRFLPEAVSSSQPPVRFVKDKSMKQAQQAVDEIQHAQRQLIAMQEEVEETIVIKRKRKRQILLRDEHF